MHLGKCLENNDWESIRKDLKKYPVEGRNENSGNNEILEILSKYGIRLATSDQQPATSNQQPVTISLWGTGSPYREFLYVDDLADACVFLMQKIDFKDLKAIRPEPHALSPVPSEINHKPNADIKNTHINIGTGRDLTIKELAELVKHTIGFKGQLEWDSTKPDGTFRKLLDVSKINKLGWKEKISLENGLKMMYKTYSV
jgi:GDP-L-fucose synthase